ncbi:MAG: hypothetical protein R2738_00120 [Bacteroides graminisolvens]
MNWEVTLPYSDGTLWADLAAFTWIPKTNKLLNSPAVKWVG